MAVNKVVMNTENGAETLIDLTNDTVSSGEVFKGTTFHGSDGEAKTGTFTISEEITEQDALIAQIKTALQGKASVGDGPQAQEKTVDITENGTHVIVPDGGYVLNKATVNVNVPIPDGYIQPSGSMEVTENGTYDVTKKASVVVSVPEQEIRLQNIEVTENGTYSADSGYDGIGQVTVNVEGSGGTADPHDQYQRVEYITSAEEATYPYIITDFFADNSCGMEIIASFPVMQDRIPMGSRQDSGATRFYCVYPLSTSSVYYGFNSGVTISCALKVNTIYRLQTNFLNSRLVNVYEENGTRKASGSINATLTTQTVPVSIFGYHSASSGSVSSKREFKLYSARCSKGHEVVREYIPCYRKSDGVVGLYEKFTNQFLTAVTGAFTKGAEIDW